MSFYTVFLNLLGFFIFLFIFWTKLKEDYTSDQIFSTAFLLLFFVLGGFWLANFFFSRFWFWSVFLGGLVAVLLICFRAKFPFYEIYEAFVISFLPWLSFVFLLDAMKTTSWYSFGGFLVIWLLVVFYAFLSTHYKSFGWYHSGKVGFSGLSISAVFFLIRSGVAFFFPFVLSLSGNLEMVFSGIFSLSFFLLLFILSR